MAPFFTVVIPTYNCADFLKRAITSVFSQTYQNFEVIVIDNSSTDNTANVLASFDNNSLNIFKVSNNGIIAYSRNKGIKNAKGDWIAFLDSDDVWKPEKLEKVKDAINHNPEVVLICHDEQYVEKGEAKNRLTYGPAVRNLYQRLLFKGNCVSTSATCLRKDIALETGGFSEREEFKTAEDYEYWIRLAQVGEFYFIKEVLGEFHIHSENLSSKINIHTNAGMAVKEYHFGLWLSKFPNMNKKVKYGRGKMWADTGAVYIKSNQFDDAAKCALKAMKFNPWYWKVWAVLLLGLFKIKIN